MMHKLPLIILLANIMAPDFFTENVIREGDFYSF